MFSFTCLIIFLIKKPINIRIKVNTPTTGAIKTPQIIAIIKRKNKAQKLSFEKYVTKYPSKKEPIK